jgi:predicted ATP-grasp superfamily ATP-dependent carboligase
MRVFLSEYITSGALAGEPLPASLLREGLAMRDALVADLAAIADVQVVTTCDPRVQWPAFGEGLAVESPAAERAAFERLCVESDAALVIAPEIDGVLRDRGRVARELSPRPLNCLPDAVELCGDKLALANRLNDAGVPTLPTQLRDEAVELEFPLVVKPRCGAGSQATYLCRSAAELDSHRVEYSDERWEARPIVQPYVAGRALSVAGVFDLNDGRLLDVWPVAAQHLSDDGTFAYLGGEVPARGVAAGDVVDVIERSAALVPGLRGYVGFDLLVAQEPGRLLLVEINPRLTTSYVGYRRLSRTNLAPLLLGGSAAAPEWRAGRIAYLAGGEVYDS